MKIQFFLIALAIITLVLMTPSGLSFAFAGVDPRRMLSLAVKRVKKTASQLRITKLFKEGDIKITDDGKGNLTIAKADMDELLKSAGEAAVAEHEKKHPPAPPTPPIQPAAEAKAGDFDEPVNEAREAKRRRLAKAITMVKLGKCRIEYAPKEIQLVRLLKSVAKGDQEMVENILGPEKALTEGSATDGGNLVPIQFGADLLVAIEDYGTCRRDADVQPMTTNELDLRSVTTKPVVSVNGELVESAESATKFGKPTLTASLISGHQILSLQLLEDNNVQLYQRLLDLFGEALGANEDTRGLQTEILDDFANTTVTTMASASIQEIKYKELVTLNRSLSKGKLARGGKYYMHETIFGVIEGMVDTTGRPIVQPAYGEMGPRLFGRPVEFNEALPGIGDDAPNTAFIIFGNLKWLVMGDRTGVSFSLLDQATVPKSGGGSVNLATQGAKAIYVYMRNGFELTIPGNVATLATKA